MSLSKKVLILGGLGRIGRQVAADLLNHTDAAVTVTGRQLPTTEDLSFFPRFVDVIKLDLAVDQTLMAAIRQQDLVIHCAGPFHHRDGRVLQHCLDAGVDYVDVSDHRSFYQRVKPLHENAIASGVTAILNTGIFPGISNSMVRQGIEQLDKAETIQLSYVVAGSGGAGLTVMRTTFLGLREPFQAWLNGRWQQILPYTQRETIIFPPPYGKTGVYWFDVPETYTFAESFDVQNVITKFGSIPDFYNHLTWITAHIFPPHWVNSPKGIEFFSNVSYQMTAVTDRWSGIGVAISAAVIGKKDRKSANYRATMVHGSTAIAAGAGTGMVAQAILSGNLKKPGIYPVEQAFSTHLFREGCQNRDIIIDHHIKMAAEVE